METYRAPHRNRRCDRHGLTRTCVGVMKQGCSQPTRLSQTKAPSAPRRVHNHGLRFHAPCLSTSAIAACKRQAGKGLLAPSLPFFHRDPIGRALMNSLPSKSKRLIRSSALLLFAIASMLGLISQDLTAATSSNDACRIPPSSSYHNRFSSLVPLTVPSHSACCCALHSSSDWGLQPGTSDALHSPRNVPRHLRLNCGIRLRLSVCQDKIDRSSSGTATRVATRHIAPVMSNHSCREPRESE